MSDSIRAALEQIANTECVCAADLDGTPCVHMVAVTALAAAEPVAWLFTFKNGTSAVTVHPSHAEHMQAQLKAGVSSTIKSIVPLGIIEAAE